jgi:predicted TIM-barrel fold metal-dependent hydrolase
MTALAERVDVDVHVAPATLEPLLEHMDDYWADYVANGELHLSPSMNGMYPPVAFEPSADGEETPTPVPASLEQLRAGLGDDRIAILNCITPFDTTHNVYYEAALCSGVNDWVRTEFLDRDPRLRASLLIPSQDPDAAIDEIARLGSHPGFVQALLPVRTDMPWGNKRFHRLHSEIAKHRLVLGLHAWGRVGNAPTTSGFTTSYLEDYLHNSQTIAQAQLTSLVSEGAFERTPELKVAILECGCTWLPFLLWRFDKDWKSIWREVPWVRERPSAYVLRSMRFSTAPAQLPADPAVLARIPELMPVADLLMYASDYPHRHGGALDPLLEIVDDDAREKILSVNASDLYGLGAERDDSPHIPAAHDS